MQEEARLLIEIGPCPSCWRICSPIVTVEPTLHDERRV
jgi:hypothetical protein